jgi:hypothetical protein
LLLIDVNLGPPAGSSDQRHRFVLLEVWQPRSKDMAFDGWMVASNFTGCTRVVVATATAPDFKRITSATDPRQIQLGGRLRF